jgi:hypothetical protein
MKELMGGPLTRALDARDRDFGDYRTSKDERARREGKP